MHNPLSRFYRHICFLYSIAFTQSDPTTLAFSFLGMLLRRGPLGPIFCPTHAFSGTDLLPACLGDVFAHTTSFIVWLKCHMSVDGEEEGACSRPVILVELEHSKYLPYIDFRSRSTSVPLEINQTHHKSSQKFGSNLGSFTKNIYKGPTSVTCSAFPRYKNTTCNAHFFLFLTSQPCMHVRGLRPVLNMYIRGRKLRADCLGPL